jgi:N-glycosylase/DNA lyase
MFSKIKAKVFGSPAIVVSGVPCLDLSQIMECGQCFRHQRLSGGKEGAFTAASTESCSAVGRPGADENYVEYMTVIRGKLFFLGQREAGELIAYDCSDEDFDSIIVPYFALDKDYEAMRRELLLCAKSEFIEKAAECAEGIRILSQEPWEALFSFIVSQNNNIPRIRKIIRAICAAYGENAARKQGIEKCPLTGEDIDERKCALCGACYSFPSATDIVRAPEKLLPSKPGFRYKYLLDCSEKVTRGEVNLDRIKEKGSYDYTLSELKKILGVGDKVASCAALFGFENYEAFPVDVWMKRAIDVYFDGKLDIEALGKYRGITQQYIFHYIRNLEEN